MNQPPQSPSAPANYGAVSSNDINTEYHQPGQVYPPKGAVPNEPPPNYEPPKTQQPSGNPNYNQGYPQYPQPYPQVQQTVIVRQLGLGQDPTPVQCPNCSAFVTTSTQSTTGAVTWLSAGLICLFG